MATINTPWRGPDLDKCEAGFIAAFVRFDKTPKGRETMTNVELNAIEARAAKASPNLVHMTDDQFSGQIRKADDFSLIATMPEWADYQADFELFAAAQGDVLALVAEGRRLRCAVARLESEITIQNDQNQAYRAYLDGKMTLAELEAIIK